MSAVDTRSQVREAGSELRPSCVVGFTSTADYTSRASLPATLHQVALPPDPSPSATDGFLPTTLLSHSLSKGTSHLRPTSTAFRAPVTRLGSFIHFSLSRCHKISAAKAAGKRPSGLEVAALSLDFLGTHAIQRLFAGTREPHDLHLSVDA